VGDERSLACDERRRSWPFAGWHFAERDRFSSKVEEE
jgi:hypothetical protein